MAGDLRHRAGRRPDRRHQPDAWSAPRSRSGSAIPAPRCSARAMACAAFATATMSTSPTVPEDQLRLIAGTPSAALGSHPRQAGRRLLRGRPQGPEEGRRRRLHLYRRQRHVRHAADPDRRGRRQDRFRPCAEDHRQRSDGERPHAGLHLGRPSSSPAPSSASISISARCPASMSASSWAAMPAS